MPGSESAGATDEDALRGHFIIRGRPEFQSAVAATRDDAAGSVRKKGKQTYAARLSSVAGLPIIARDIGVKGL